MSILIYEEGIIVADEIDIERITRIKKLFGGYRYKLFVRITRKNSTSTVSYCQSFKINKNSYWRYYNELTEKPAKK